MSDQAPSTPGDQWLSIGDVARILRLPERSVMQGTLRQKLRWVKCGKHLRLPRAELGRFAASTDAE